MAEFCPECWLRMNENDDINDYILSDEPELCEGCGEMKYVIAAERRRAHRGFSVRRVLRILHGIIMRDG